jgi:hypothetical protein
LQAARDSARTALPRGRNVHPWFADDGSQARALERYFDGVLSEE